MNYPQLWRSSGLAFPLLLAVLAPPAHAAGHTVRSGETLTSIAKQYQVPLSTLQKANPGINPAMIAKGQILKVPGSTPSAPPPAQDKTGAKSSPVTAVKPGNAPVSKKQVLASLPAARRPVAAEADHLTATPAPKRPASKGITTYKVRSGETLVALARRHGVSVADLVEMNGLDSTELLENQKLILPATNTPAAPAPPQRQAVLR